MDGGDRRWRAQDYGDHNAALYDQIYPRLDPRIVPLLCGLAGDRPILELGVGSGRLGVPLAARGACVLGVDASSAMLRRLRARDTARDVMLVRADLAALPCGPSGFGLAVALADTLSLLPDRAAQAACLQGVATALTPGGMLVYEGSDDPLHAADTVQWRTIAWRGSHSGEYRYPQLALPPATLDLLASWAGLRLLQRWSDWSRRPWQAGALQVISVYGR